MFLKMDSFFLQPNTEATIHLYNGTIDKSENVITRDRMLNVSLVGNGKTEHPTEEMWTEDGFITVLNFKSGASGTWVAGVSTAPRNIEMSAKDFNEYLEHDGILDILEWRKEHNQLDSAAVEKYSKHVKAIFQVGDTQTEDWKKPLGYPIEFVPQSNPYAAQIGEEISFQLLRDGQALKNQLIYSGFRSDHGHSHEHDHDREEGATHRHDEGQLMTDENGIVTLNINHEGQWFLRTIHMVHSEEEGLTHESNWATLTFEVKAPKGGLPNSIQYLISALIAAVVTVSIVSLMRRRKK